jgi:DNA-binding winged helix-turn-helix (wHTH) protein
MDGISQGKAFRLGKWLVEPMLDQISCMGEVVRIEPQNMKLLLRLAAQPGAVISLEEIESAVWRGLVVTPNSVYQSVAQLRRALGDTKTSPSYIQTVPRKGYRLVAPVNFQTDPVSLEATPVSLDAAPSVREASEPEPQLPIDTPLERRARGFRPWLVPATSIALSVIALSLATHFYYDRKSDATATVVKHGPMSSSPHEKIDLIQSATEAALTANSRATSIRLLIELGDYASRLGNPEQARVHFERAFALQAQVARKDDLQIAMLLSRLANIDLWQSRYADAEAKAREAVRIFEETAPALHPSAARAHDVLSNLLLSTGRHAEAASHAESSLELARLLYGDLHVRTLDAESSMALIRLAQGRLDEAEAWARRALKDHIAARGEEIDGAYLRNTLAQVLYKKGRHAKAIAEATDALAVLAQIGSPDHPYATPSHHVLGESLIKLGKCDEAERALLNELRILKNNKMDQWRIARATSALGEALLGQGRIREAEEHLMQAARELDGAKGWMENQARLITQERMQHLRRVKTATLLSETAHRQ